MRYVFNLFNILLIILYTFLCILMSKGGATSSFQAVGASRFEMMMLVIWGTIFTFERIHKKLASFNFDLFVMTYVFVVAILISLIFEEKNADVLGWWAMLMVLGFFLGFIWSMVFAGFATMMKSHEVYTKYYSLFILAILVLNQVLVSAGYISEIYLYFSLTIALITHVAICLLQRFKKQI